MSWLEGRDKAVRHLCFVHWVHFHEAEKIQRELERRHESAKLAAMSWLEGRGKAVRHLCFIHWVHFHEAEKLHRHKDDLQSQLDNVFESHYNKVNDLESLQEKSRLAVEL